MPRRKTFLVTWRVSLDATDFVEAARAAQLMHRDPHSIASVFDVKDEFTGNTRRVDLIYPTPHVKVI